MFLFRLFLPAVLLFLSRPFTFAQSASVVPVAVDSATATDAAATAAHALGPKALTGSIVDELKNPLAGVTVKLRGTSQQLVCITNSAGRFLLPVPASSGTISISFEGYYTQEVAFGPILNTAVTLLPLPGFRRDRKARVIYRRHNRAVSAYPEL